MAGTFADGARPWTMRESREQRSRSTAVGPWLTYAQGKFEVESPGKLLLSETGLGGVPCHARTKVCKIPWPCFSSFAPEYEVFIIVYPFCEKFASGHLLWTNPQRSEHWVIDRASFKQTEQRFRCSPGKQHGPWTTVPRGYRSWRPKSRSRWVRWGRPSGWPVGEEYGIVDQVQAIVCSEKCMTHIYIYYFFLSVVEAIATRAEAITTSCKKLLGFDHVFIPSLQQICPICEQTYQKYPPWNYR